MLDEWVFRCVVAFLGGLAAVWALKEEKVNGMKKAILWGLVAFAVVAFVAWLVIALVGLMGVDAKCTALGYADSSLSWTFQGYCETRIRDTDYVIPVDEAEVWMETTGKELMGR